MKDLSFYYDSLLGLFASLSGLSGFLHCQLDVCIICDGRLHVRGNLLTHVCIFTYILGDLLLSVPIVLISVENLKPQRLFSLFVMVPYTKYKIQTTVRHCVVGPAIPSILEPEFYLPAQCW